MQSIRTIIALAAVALLAIGLAQSAPTETDTSTTPMTPESKTDTPTSTTPQESMAVSSAQDQTRSLNTSFSCYNRSIGYYADVATSCQVYHFCSPGDFNGEIAYQRISYLCLNETKFDQQALDCVSEDKVSAPCVDSEKHYDESNRILRQAVIVTSNTELKTGGHDTTSTTSTPEASSSTEAASTEGSTTTTTTPATSTQKANEINTSA